MKRESGSGRRVGSAVLFKEVNVTGELHANFLIMNRLVILFLKIPIGFF